METKNKEDLKIVIGHKNPDTDSVVSAFVWSSVLNKIGEKAKPAIAGEVNKETEFIFKEAGLEIPKKEDLKGRPVFLVDHNEKRQRADGAENLVGVLDHHKLEIVTDGPIFFRNEPLGSTATIIKKITKEKGIDLGKDNSFLILCAIISDTLKFNSPITTDLDIKYVKEIAKELNVNIDELAERMFAAKSDLSDMSIKEIILNDYKDFDLGGSKVGVGVAEVVSPDFFNSKTEKIISTIEEIKKREGLDYLLFGVIDILEKNTLLYLSSKKEEELAEKAFGIKIENNPEVLKNVASRKKQIIPPLSEVLEK